MTERWTLLAGGRSAERDVSLNSGKACGEALQRLDIDFEWVDPIDADWLQRVQKLQRPVLSALHGGDGENGVVQGALQSLGLAYTGSGVMASALAMDKQRCKFLWQGMGLPTAEFAMLHGQSDWQAIIDELGSVMVKPVREGSSIGMARADDANSLEQAWSEASRYDAMVMAEAWIDGPEYTVAVLADEEGSLEALPVIGLKAEGVFYDYQAKYVSDSTQYLLPSGLSAADEVEVQALALRAFDSLACEGWGRVDVMRTAAGEWRLLEVNTIPGLTDHSLVPMAAKAAGLSFDDLMLRIMASAEVRR